MTLEEVSTSKYNHFFSNMAESPDDKKLPPKRWISRKKPNYAPWISNKQLQLNWTINQESYNPEPKTKVLLNISKLGL